MSLAFEPAPVRPRRRRVDPILIGALIVVVAVVAAIVKPWAGETGLGADASPSAVAQAAPSATSASSEPTPGSDPVEAGSSGGPAQEPSAAGGPAATLWARLAGHLEPHDAWGIRAVAATGDPSTTGTLEDTWTPVSDDARPILIQHHAVAVAAIGLTFPADRVPLDVRIWLVHAGGQLEWLDAPSIDASPAGGANLFVRTFEDGSLRPWAPGRYRIDVLTAGDILSVTAEVANLRGEVPAPTSWPVAAAGPPIEGPPVGIADLADGLFATVDGRAVALDAAPGTALDEQAAWLDVDPGTGRTPRTFAAAAFLPRVDGLGIKLPAGSRVWTASIRRLTPGATFEPPIDVGDASAPRVRVGADILFRSPDGAWRPGVYAISVQWDLIGHEEGASWHVELRPGPVRQAPRLLLALRAWARYTGQDGLLIGSAEPTHGDAPYGVAVHLLRTVPGGAADYPLMPDATCGRTVVGSAEFIGYLHRPSSARVSAVALVRRVFTMPVDQPLLVATGALDGLTIVAPADDAAFGRGSYVLTFDPGDAGPLSVACLDLG